MSILQYGFMQRAFLVGILLAVITPCIGITIVLKRMSMIGDALSHSSLAGVVLGLILGVNPVAGAVVMCIVAALGIEAIRKKIPRYSEVAISIVMSAGIGLAGVLSGFVENGASLNSFLFGSIVSISEGELALVVVISVLVLAAVLFFYREQLCLSGILYGQGIYFRRRAASFCSTGIGYHLCTGDGNRKTGVYNGRALTGSRRL